MTSIWMDPLKRHQFVDNEPWLRDPNVRNAWSAHPKYARYSPVGGIMGFWDASRGSDVAAIANLIWRNNYASRLLGNVQFNGSATSYVQIDTLAAAVTGLAKPFTLFISAQLPAAPSSGIWYLLSITNSVSNTPGVVIEGVSGSTSFTIGRRNNSGVLFTSSTFSPGTNPFILIAVYDGANLTTRFNGVLVDNAIPFGGGGMPVDQYSLGVSRQPSGGGYSSPNYRVHVFSAAAVPASSYLGWEAFERRKIGI